jgi:hypothetical protein
VSQRGAAAQSGSFGDVPELPVARIVVQSALTEVRHVQIRTPVIVVVADTDALAPPDACETGAFGDVLEPHPAAIPVQMAGRRLAIGVSIERRGIHHEYVHQAVVVEIKNGDAVTGRLENVLFSVLPACDVHGGEARLFGDVAEIDGDLGEIGLDPRCGARGASGGAHPLKHDGTAITVIAKAAAAASRAILLCWRCKVS